MTEQFPPQRLRATRCFTCFHHFPPYVFNYPFSCFFPGPFHTSCQLTPRSFLTQNLSCSSSILLPSSSSSSSSSFSVSRSSFRALLHRVSFFLDFLFFEVLRLSHRSSLSRLPFHFLLVFFFFSLLFSYCQDGRRCSH